ncbi:hypothetical protein CDV31_009664 [Fusarium ambrosium]|uniref:Nephrocystin 3-like N-terminal domain-containing protein n=1 Tax=Fusarium ambrosium TaxID=131363 RepID=A0A428TTA6_9HYPO|nr:hypothetical protein CDV31_009664 [Fusarium ambrosium]
MKGISSAVGFAAKLKPEIRLAQAISEFGASLNTQNQRTRFKNLQSQSPPSPDDIIRLTEEINRDGARAHRSWRPYGTRLVAILDRMRQFAPIGDVLVGGSQNLIACGVWAVTSLSFLSYFENVTSMMLRLGQSLSLHQDFVLLFPKCSTLQSYMCEYTIVMVNICAKIIHNCAKSALFQLAASFTSTFDAAFKPLESDLTTWAQLIEKRVTVLLAKADLQTQSSVLERFNRLQITMSRDSAAQRKEKRRHRLFTALCPYQGEFNLIWRRERKRGTSSWMYEQEEYKSWLSSKAEAVLWLKGNLGSGKTVTMASAAAHLILAAPGMEPKGAVTVSYFFCQSDNPKTLSATTLLGSIVGQVLQNLAQEPSLMSFLEQTEITQDSCARLKDFVEILLKCTPSNWRGIFILDGLDEMPQEDADDVFGQLKRLNGHRRSNMDVEWTLSMETADRSDEIRAYIATEISRWNRIRPLPTELERLVEEQLVAGCQGMFLWLSLQIADICPRYTQELRSDAEILNILGNLPKDLPDAFDKALLRMRASTSGNRLFKLVASAEPPMNMDELRVAFNVEPGNARWDDSTLVSSGKALVSASGGSLLDIDEEDFRVRFIHYSALLHLTTPSSDVKTHSFHFDLEEAERELGAVCVTYLNYSIFENRVSTAQKASFGQVPQATAGSVMRSETSRKVFSLLAKHRRHRDARVDLERLSYELQKNKWRVRDDVHLFLDYAKDQWLSSTRHLWINDRYGMLPLFGKLLINPAVSASLPWDSIFEATEWALKNDHATLFQYYLHSDDQDYSQKALSAAAHAVSTQISNIRTRGEGLGWLAPLYIVHPQYQASVLQDFIELDCKPFNPALEKPPCPDLTASAVTTSAESHLVVALTLYSRTPEEEKLVLFLAKYLQDPNLVVYDNLSLLYFATHRGCVPLAFELLSRGANPDGGHRKGGSSPLQNSIKNGLTKLALELIELGADTTANPDDEYPPLFLAINISNLELVISLLEQDTFASKKGYGRGREDVCHYLVTIGCKLEEGFVGQVLDELIRHGANIDSKNSHGETPLILAVKEGSLHLVELLLAHGANPNNGDRCGARPLHFARSASMIQNLFRRGADLDAVTYPGYITPLMAAVLQGHADAVSLLLGEGADPTLRLGASLTTEILLFGVKQDAASGYPANATAFELCLWRLKQELEALSTENNAKQPGNLCHDLALMFAEFLECGIGSYPQYTEDINRLGDVLRELSLPTTATSIENRVSRLFPPVETRSEV